MNRNSTQILCEVLDLTQSQTSTSEIIRSVNLAHPRFKVLMTKLVNSGLVVKISKDYVITDKGRILLDEYKKFHDIAEAFGLEI